MNCIKCNKDITARPRHIYYPFDEVQIIEDVDGNPTESLQGTISVCDECLEEFKITYNV